MGHNVCVLVVCQLRRIISKLLKCAISGNLWIYAWNIPFMGVYQDVLLRQSVFLNKWLHIYCRLQNTKYNDENTRIWLSTRKRLDKHPWRVCFNRQKKVSQVQIIIQKIAKLLHLEIYDYLSGLFFS